MTIKQCIQKNGWRVEVDEMKRFQSGGDCLSGMGKEKATKRSLISAAPVRMLGGGTFRPF